MRRTIVLVAVLLGATMSSAMAGPRNAVTIIKGHASSDPVATRSAWDRLSDAGPDALLPILWGWPENDPVATFWLGTAFERIAARHRADLPIDGLMDILTDPSRPGRARRLALSAVEAARPGTRAHLFKGWINDPEFGGDVIDIHITEAEAALEAKNQDQAIAILKTAFDAVTEVDQAFALAKLLGQLDANVDVVAQLGVVRNWNLVGPFAVPPHLGLVRTFPPETRVDLDATYPDGSKTLRWKPVQASLTDGHVDLIKLVVDPNEGSVLYSATVVVVPEATPAELRIGRWITSSPGSMASVSCPMPPTTGATFGQTVTVPRLGSRLGATHSC